MGLWMRFLLYTYHIIVNLIYLNVGVVGAAIYEVAAEEIKPQAYSATH